jgi:hypothetical protein
MALGEFGLRPIGEFEGVLGELGMGAEFTPREQMAAFAGRHFRPGRNRLREAFYAAEEPLRARHTLRTPFLTTGTGEDERSRTFEDYLYNIGADDGIIALNRQELLNRARQAAAVSGMTLDEYQNWMTDPNVGGGARAEAMRAELLPLAGDVGPGAWYRETYGTGRDAAQNQAELAYALALQRAGGGTYGGQMRGAIRSSIDELARQHAVSSTQGESFLDWYLDRFGG